MNKFLEGSGAPDGTAIAVDRLHVVRSGRAVIDDLSVQVPRGRVTGLLGPSGCGKSTLMRAIVGVQVVAGGTVQVLGHPAGSRPLRSRIGYLTQAPSVYADLTVGENLRYFAAVLGAPASDVDRVVAEVGLDGYTDHLTGALSGGQRARVSLAAALLGTPELLVLDEPTVGLDPVLRRDLWDAFARLAEGGTTLLVSSHVMDEAGRCASCSCFGTGACSRRSRRPRCSSRPAHPTLTPPFSRSWSRRSDAEGRARHCGTGPPAAARRPAHARTRVRRPAPPAHALQVRLLGTERDVRPDRGPARRPVPVHLAVPRHLDRGAAGADEWDAGAADDAPPREARPARRLRARVRARRGAAGIADLGGRVWAARSRRRRVALGRNRARGPERHPRHVARPLHVRVRADGAPGGAVPARARVPADPALRADRAARPDGARPRGRVSRAPADVGLRRALSHCDPRRVRLAGRTRHGDRRRLLAPRPGRGRGDAAAANGLEGSEPARQEPALDLARREAQRVFVCLPRLRSPSEAPQE